jgi:hypothetical protein
MFYIVENEEKLKTLLENDVYIDVIWGDDRQHVLLSEPTLVYVSKDGKGYIIPVSHPEGIGIPIKTIAEYLGKCKNISVLNGKDVLHIPEFKELTLIDINATLNLNENFYLDVSDISTNCYDFFYEKTNISANKIIPISKHLEKCDKIVEYIIKHTPLFPENAAFADYSHIICLEKQGIKIDKESFNTRFNIEQKYSVKDDIIYTSYNTNNLTTRPSNSFNGINFAALNKADKTRESFIPKNDVFIEFDYSAYHLLIISKMINYQFKTNDPHTELGEIYFNTSSLTKEQYLESKKISFRQIYGGIEEQYLNSEYFKKTSEMINTCWEIFNKSGEIYSPISSKRFIKGKLNNMNPQKLFNYIIQSIETYFNMKTLTLIQEHIQKNNYISNVALYLYDSFLIDYNVKDGKNVILEIKQIIEKNGFTCKAKYGEDYNSLKKITIS